MPSPKKPPSMPKSIACVHIDHVSLLLPMDAALKIMSLLEQALRVDRDFERSGAMGYIYRVRGQPDIELSKVRHDQVVQSPEAETKGARQRPLMLEG